MTNKARKLAEKLLALAKQGIGGEAENAETMLIRLLVKYDLTVEEFEQDEELFPVALPWLANDKTNRNKFTMQVIASVIGKKRFVEHQLVTNDQGRTWMKLWVRIEEKIEIETKVEVYWADYQQQMELFWSAYVQKNHLYALPDDDNEPEDQTPEDKERLYKMMKLMEGIDHKTIHKQLNHGK